MSKTEWIDISVVGSMYQEQMSLVSPGRYRHRFRLNQGIPGIPITADMEWTPGRRPDAAPKKESADETQGR